MKKFCILLGLLLSNLFLNTAFANTSNSDFTPVTSQTELQKLSALALPEFPSPPFFKAKIIDARQYGNLIAAHLSVYGADHSDAFVIITPKNKIIKIDDYRLLSEIDLKKNKDYKTLAQKAPNISIWPGNHVYPHFVKLADGTQQLQFTYRLLNGCHACAVGGTAVVGFNFDTQDNFMGVTLISLSPPAVI